MIVLDTNVISAVFARQPSPAVVAWLDAQPARSLWTTSITVFEAEVGIRRLPRSARRDALTRQWTAMLEEDLRGQVLPLDSIAAELAADLSARRQAAGRSVDLRDTLIAGIALAHGAALATQNRKHFEDAGLELLDPWAQAL